MPIAEQRELAVVPGASPQSQEPLSLLSIISAASLDPRVDVERLRALLEFKERVDEVEAKKLFQSAMIAVQDEIKPVVRDGWNDHTKSKYAKLERVDKAIRPIYMKHGFVLSFNAREMKDGLVMCCTCMHRGGYSKDYELPGALDMTGPSGTKNKTGIQAAGSTVSYLRRYLTLMIFNVVLTNEDDDGQSAAEFITPDQVNRIRGYIDALELNDARIRKFLEFMNAKEVDFILARDYQKAIVHLQAALKKEKEGKQ